MILNPIKAALSVALFIPLSVIGGNAVIEHRGLSIECHKNDSQVKLYILSNDKTGVVRLHSGTGNRLSSTINKGSTVNYSMNVEQFPVTLFYDSESKKSELLINSDCSDK